MSGREITALAIKFLALWLICNVVLYVPSLIHGMSGMEAHTGQELSTANYMAAAASFVLSGLLATIVLFRLSNSILTSTPASDDQDKAALSQRFLLQVLGVYFVVKVIAEMPGTVRLLFIESDYSDINAMYFAADVFVLAVGIWLIVSPSILGSWLARLRGRA